MKKNFDVIIVVTAVILNIFFGAALAFWMYRIHNFLHEESTAKSEI